jgi:hypothetical protein
LKTKQLGEVWIANQGDTSAIGASEEAAIEGVKDCAGTTLQPPHTAPKDGTIILGEFGWPWMLTAAWNNHDEKWAVCIIQACSMENGKVDTYWETDQEEHGALKGWLPMPEVERKQLSPMQWAKQWAVQNP